MISLSLGHPQLAQRKALLLHTMERIDEEVFRFPREGGRSDHEQLCNELDDDDGDLYTKSLVERIARLDECVRQGALLEHEEGSDDTSLFRLRDLRSFPLIVEFLLRTPTGVQRHLSSRVSSSQDSSNKTSGLNILTWLYDAVEVETDRRRLHLLHKTIKSEIAARDRERHSATINGCVFPIWDSAPLPRSFTGAAFLDPDEEPRLSPDQQLRFAGWRRPSEIYKRPVVVSDPHGSVRSSSIRQSPYVANCSLVSSLMIMAHHERKRPGFATEMLYPKNSRGFPTLSPSGKYQLRLFWNGAPRLVTIDDLLPVDDRKELLCAQSSAGELWVTLVEKAYLKLVAGGYDLWTGSHSGIDLYALTGWPPETLSFEDGSISFDDLWDRLKNGLESSSNLVTASTRTDINESTTGLSRGHAFAVLRARESVDSGKDRRRELLLRNPWGSPSSSSSTEEEEGFWMNLEEMGRHFRGIHVNWDISLFSRACHRPCAVPPGEDIHRFGFHYCPQFRIRLSRQTKGQTAERSVWLMVSRDVNDVTQLESTDNALALHVFRTDSTSKERIWLPQSESSSHVLHKGKYSSGPHSQLCRIDLPDRNDNDDGDHNGITVVISAFAAKQTVNCTLSVFAIGVEGVVEIEELPLELAGGFSRMVYSLPSPFVDEAADLWMIRFHTGNLNNHGSVSSSAFSGTSLVSDSSSTHSSLSLSPPKHPSSAAAIRLRAACGTTTVGGCDDVKQIELRLWLLDVKNSSRTLLGESTMKGKLVKRSSFAVIDADIPSALALTRTSVRFVLEPVFTSATVRKEASDDDDEDEDEERDYFVEVHSDLLEFAIIAPTDKTQQALLRRMLNEFSLKAL